MVISKNIPFLPLTPGMRVVFLSPVTIWARALLIRRGKSELRFLRFCFGGCLTLVVEIDPRGRGQHLFFARTPARFRSLRKLRADKALARSKSRSPEPLISFQSMRCARSNIPVCSMPWCFLRRFFRDRILGERPSFNSLRARSLIVSSKL